MLSCQGDSDRSALPVDVGLRVGASAGRDGGLGLHHQVHVHVQTTRRHVRRHQHLRGPGRATSVGWRQVTGGARTKLRLDSVGMANRRNLEKREGEGGRTRTRPSRNALRVVSRWFCGMSPCSARHSTLIASFTISSAHARPQNKAPWSVQKGREASVRDQEKSQADARTSRSGLTDFSKACEVQSV